MSTTTEPSSTTPTTCPLARDKDGNAIELPPGASCWRVRRKTGGRPRIVLGVDKQPIQLPLSYSIVDVEDILAPAAYLLDLVDAKGAALGVTVEIAIGQLLRNAEDGDESDGDAPAIASALPTTGSETRLVLEANVRATQMAFLHNQKTLELGLRMAESLRDGVRVMAESQADWIKSISSAKGFFRNAPNAKLLPAGIQTRDDENDDDGDEEGDMDEIDEPADEHWLDKLMPHVTPLIQVGVPILVAKLSGVLNGGSAPSAPNGKPKVNLQLGDLFDWRKPAARRKEADAETATPEPAELPPLDMEAAAHFVQIQQQLTPEEAALARGIAANLQPNELRAWFAELKQLSVADAVAKIRAFIASQPAA
jgi:hypothetical protein